MPLYEYRCTQCQHDFEQQQPVGAPAPACPRCGSPSRKVFSSVGLIFKGSGFHTTDYRKTLASDGESKAADATAGKGAKATTESKTPDTNPPAGS